MARPLWELTAEISRLNDVLEEAEGDLSKLGESEAAVAAWLDALADEQAAKLDGYVMLIRKLEAEADAAKAEEAEWAAKRRAREARAAYLTARLKGHLEKTNQPKVTTAIGRLISVVKNGGAVPMAIKPGTDPAALPEEFVRYVPELDRAAVRAALEAGRELDFAELLPRGTGLRIK